MPGLNRVQLDDLDLNLVRVLDALLSTGSHRATAARLHVTESAVSHALRRLRQELGDPLLVPGRGRMIPTPAAEKLAPRLRKALDALAGAFEDSDAFDPRTTRATWRIATADFMGMLLLPPLAKRLADEAPHASLHAAPPPADGLAELEGGTMDLLLALNRDVPSSIRRQALFRERFVCVLRANHPALKRPLNLERYLEYTHVAIAPGGGRGTLVDDALLKLGKTRRIAMVVPHFLIAPMVVAQTDHLLIAPERIARRTAATYGLEIVPAPLELQSMTFSQLWHERVHDDPAHAWLRKQLADVARAERPEGEG